MSATENNTNKSSTTTYLPQTEEEKAEAFRLLDEFEGALASWLAFREALVESLAGSRQRRQLQ